MNLIQKIRYFLLLLLILSVKTYAYNDNNNDCHASVNGQPVYTLNYTLKVDNILVSTPNGTVVGSLLAKRTDFTCDVVHMYAWGLQVIPNAVPNGEMPRQLSICQTNIKGIGIQYINYLGQPINCLAWDAIFTIPATQRSGTLEEGTVLARIIKIGNVPNGQSYLKLLSTLSAYFYGSTNSTPWGQILSQGSNLINSSQYYPQIYFPLSPNSTPIVNLNISNNFHGRRGLSVQQSSNLDMCLYDGNNSSSKGLKLIFNDNTSGVSGRSPDEFSIFRIGGDRNNIKDRLDYVVSIINPITGASQKVKNGIEIYWSGINVIKILR